ncbi:MAG TPA: isoprenylcysteine carboxylmethyltransferase family protein [Anaeromyxobacteraceae bacterium]|nr:isoprenylcysteine carboxylmethyltransferase family protein [Anaeromyxobacteraceae bacterium]
MLLLLAICSMVVLHLLLPVAGVQTPAWRLLGLLPLIAGIVLNLAADRALREAGTTVKPLLDTTALLTKGVFAVTRNPMYFGFILLLSGIWLSLGSLSPGLVVAVFAVLIDRYYVRPEEEKLTRTFGEAFRAYRGRVGRWF